MKKIIVVVAAIILSTIVLFTYNVYNANNLEEISYKSETESNNVLSIMLETNVGSGQYKVASSSTWPTAGYVFNSELSKCENGSALSWNDTNKQVIFSGNVSDKCYVYFDVDNKPKITSVDYEYTQNSIKMTVNVKPSAFDVTSYFFSKDDGVTYTEATSNVFTFDNLEYGKAVNIKIYVMDSNANQSTNYENIDSPDLILGDADGDNDITVNDVSMIFNYFDKLYEFNRAQMKAMNVVPDGSVDFADAQTLFAYVSNDIDSLPYNGNVYDIKYELDGGTINTCKFRYIPELSNDDDNLDNPVKEGYTFTGWTGSNGTTPQTTVSLNGLTGNLTFKANWQQNS